MSIILKPGYRTDNFLEEMPYFFFIYIIFKLEIFIDHKRGNHVLPLTKQSYSSSLLTVSNPSESKPDMDRGEQSPSLLPVYA